MLSGRTYEHSLNTIFLNQEKKELLTSVKNIRDALATTGVKLGSEVRCNEWEKLFTFGRLLLLTVNYVENKNRNWHWVIFDPTKNKNPILDPRKKEATVIDHRVHLYSYFLLWR